MASGAGRVPSEYIASSVRPSFVRMVTIMQRLTKTIRDQFAQLRMLVSCWRLRRSPLCSYLTVAGSRRPGDLLRSAYGRHLTRQYKAIRCDLCSGAELIVLSGVRGPSRIAVVCSCVPISATIAMQLIQRTLCTQNCQLSSPLGGCVPFANVLDRNPRNCCSSTACRSSKASAHVRATPQCLPLVLSVVTTSQLLGAGCPAYATAARHHLDSHMEVAAVLHPSLQHEASALPSVRSNGILMKESHISGTALVESFRAPSLIEASAAGAAVNISLPPLPTTFPDLPKLQQPDIYQEVLPNGLKVFLLTDQEVPLIRGALLMAGGQTSSPADQVGLASLAVAVQRSGGSVTHPAAIIDERLEDLAAAIEGSAGQQATTFDFQCLSQDITEILQLLYELLTQPALPQDKLDVVKAQARNGLEHRDDNASSVARRELYKLLYGQDSIYARTSTVLGIASITQEDLATHISAWQRPDNAILGLVGDFDSQQMMDTTKQVFGSWSPAAGQPAKPLPRPQEQLEDLPPILEAANTKQQQQQRQQQQQQQQRKVFLIDRPDAGQSSVFVGEPGLSLRDPDVYALDILSARLNGFGGILFDELRTRQGLAYSVSAGWNTPVDHRGLFVAAAETAQPAKFIQELNRVLASTREVPLTDQELATAKAGLLNSFVFNFASTYSQLQRTMVYQLLGLPKNFLFEYRDCVEAVTAEQVIAAASHYLHPEKQTVVVVGDQAVVGPELEAAGFTVQLLQPVPPA